MYTIKPPIHKAILLKLVEIGIEQEKKRENESELDRMKRLLIRSSVDTITENVLFNAKIGNIYYKASYLSKDLILDIYDGVKLNFPDCKILLNIKELSMVVHWGK